MKINEILSFGVYKNEAIDWEIKEIKDDKIFLVTKNIIDSKPFDTNINVSKYGNNKWIDSELRKWLNTDFYNNAFSDEEKSKILLTDLQDVNSKDKVFLLSDDEVYKYYLHDSDRVKQGTIYAKNNGLWLKEDGEYAGNSFWWLRSTVGTSGIYAVYYNGDCDYFVPNSKNTGVVCGIIISKV